MQKDIFSVPDHIFFPAESTHTLWICDSDLWFCINYVRCLKYISSLAVYKAVIIGNDVVSHFKVIIQLLPSPFYLFEGFRRKQPAEGLL